MFSSALPSQLAEALKANSSRVLDLFRSWDSDGDGEVSRAEFHKAVPALGLDVPKADIDELFNSWDKECAETALERPSYRRPADNGSHFPDSILAIDLHSGGGALAYREVRRILSGGGISKDKKKLSGKGPLSDQLAEALRANASRVLDLFRSWDTNSDGEVSRLEFHKAVPALGLEVPTFDVDELFNTWDKDGGGSLAYKELKRILQAPPPNPGAQKLGNTATVIRSASNLRAAATASKTGSTVGSKTASVTASRTDSPR